ncbi:MAG: hypothetical protein ABI665_03130 [Vicinamibacterales bacterium]
MISIVVSGFVVIAVAAQSQPTMFPLVDAADPVRLSEAVLDAADPDHPAIEVRLENTTSRQIELDQIWLRASQFFTPSEVARNKDGVAYFCGRMTRPRFDESETTLPPHGSVYARLPIGSECRLDAPHVHMFIHVASIGPGPIDQAIWFRDPASFVRLLAAAMPHP